MGCIRPARKEDLARCMEIYAAAQRFMVKAGNPNQWEPGFPPEAQIAEDIAGHHLMVWTDAEDVPQGAFAYLPGPEPDYAKIYERGIGSAMMRWALEHAEKEGVALRVDTHKDNVPMQKLIRRCGFVFCGIIHLSRTGDERVAFTHVF